MTYGRYDRQLLLPEIGPEGQETLLKSSFLPLPCGQHEEALAFAATYLERAGLRHSTQELRSGEVSAELEERGPTLHLQCSTEEVQAISGQPYLEPCAALLWGSFQAVEAVKAALHIGVPASAGAVPVLSSSKYPSPGTHPQQVPVLDTSCSGELE